MSILLTAITTTIRYIPRNPSNPFRKSLSRKTEVIFLSIEYLPWFWAHDFRKRIDV